MCMSIGIQSLLSIITNYSYSQGILPATSHDESLRSDEVSYIHVTFVTTCTTIRLEQNTSNSVYTCIHGRCIYVIYNKCTE